MNQFDLKERLAAYYGEQSLPPDRGERLAQMAKHWGGADGRQPMRRMAVSLRHGFAIAASLVLAAFALGYFAGSKNSTSAMDAPHKETTLVGHEQLPAEIKTDSLKLVPRIVAVKFNIDGCPWSAATAPVFADLTQEYASKYIAFAQLELANEAKKRNSRQIARAMGIEWVYDEGVRSGMIEIVDREKKVILAKVTEPDERKTLMDVLDSASKR